MKIVLDKKEKENLKKENIIIDSSKDFEEDEVFEIVERIRDVENYYAQDSDWKQSARELANVYGDIADKIQDMIP